VHRTESRRAWCTQEEAVKFSQHRKGGCVGSRRCMASITQRQTSCYPSQAAHSSSRLPLATNLPQARQPPTPLQKGTGAPQPHAEPLARQARWERQVAL
jgi:hypothetical protein